MPEDAWSLHPQVHEGNTAARLITVGGGENDAVAGEMKPTASLAACPYIQQVLASFNTVWSRSRLMRIAGGGSVPQHSDMNYHWFHRVRLHVPVVTRPEVRFHCGGESVHMAAGEAWIFDNWREHKVENPTSDARIHLVADTAGTSDFWRLAATGRSKDFSQPDAGSRLVAFDPAASPRLLFERFNASPVMPPAEVEQLTYDLLADLAPADARAESAAAVARFVTTMIEFCHDWRSLWTMHGNAPGDRSAYQQLVRATRKRIAELSPVRIASTGYSAQSVLNARLIAHLVGDASGPPREAAEFNVAAATPTPDPTPPVQPVPLGTETVTFELPQVELPTVEVQRIESPAPEPHKPPVLERPLIILSAPRAGSTLLFETLAQAAGVYTIGGESHQLIESIAALRPGRGVVSSNRLTRKDATTVIVAELRRRFAGRLHDRDGQPPPVSGASVRLLEKTPEERVARAFPARGLSGRAVRFPAPGAPRKPRQHDGGLAQRRAGLRIASCPVGQVPGRCCCRPATSACKIGRSRKSWHSSGGRRTKPYSTTSQPFHASAGRACVTRT